MTSDGFLVCSQHGDIFWTEGANGATPLEASNVEPIHPQAPTPISGARCMCFCGRPLAPVVRPRVVVLQRGLA